MLRHLRLPSFQPAIAILATMGSVITSCTPSTLRIFHANVSMAVMSSWLVQAGSFVSTITVRMSTPIENLLVMMLLSRL